MKFEIDINSSTLSEYINEDESGCVTFTDLFKEIIVSNVFTKAKLDYDVREYIKSEIKDGLYQIIVSYKQESAIKAVIDDVIREELSSRRSGSLIFANQYVDSLKKEIRKQMSKYEEELKKSILVNLENETKRIVDSIYKDSAIKDYLDSDKMARHIVRNLVENKQNIQNSGEFI